MDVCDMDTGWGHWETLVCSEIDWKDYLRLRTGSYLDLIALTCTHSHNFRRHVFYM